MRKILVSAPIERRAALTGNVAQFHPCLLLPQPFRELARPISDDDIRAAALAGSFLTLAIVMGEFTIANLSAFHTFPIFIQYVNESQGFPAASLTLLSFGITWAAMGSLLVVGRKRGQRAAFVAGAR